ncbi:Caleosin-domain-containing protein [Wolfiporia cocos MD-104 SS10]|uniref:Caleosin-domain-containing protein n=1 Tax=Wolfiporia cocos (strain MD-104) TaxID=742152 RepID=A0A2H3JN78_WOLCO|nr:Caleosin-domain-containing protein [Wolfiporia cocos MD-104 SS10]
MIVEPNSNMLKMTPSTDADMQAPPSYDIVMASSGPFVPGGASKADNVKVPYQGPSSGTAGPASQTPAMPATTVYNYYNPVTHEHVASLLPPDHPQMICLQRGGHVPHTRYGVLDHCTQFLIPQFTVVIHLVMLLSLLIYQSAVRTFIRQVSVTYERIPHNPTESEGDKLVNPGTARANLAPSLAAPEGTQADDWAAKHRHQTVLQQHCAYFDPDHDGVVWPLDTFRGFYNLGFNLFLCAIAVVIIHSSFSYATSSSWVPDPFFRVSLNNIHKAKHGSDTGTFDNEGRFIPQKSVQRDSSMFEDLFSKYSGGKGGLNKWDIANVLKGQRVLLDPTGTFGAFFEWLSIYLLFWPEDGIIKKEDVRRVYDGSIFPELAARRSGKTKAD